MKELLSKNNRENIKTTNQTWVVKNAKGQIVSKTDEQELMEVKSVYYGKLKDIVKLITLKEFMQMATLEVINKGGDERNHKPITKEEIEKILKEEL